MSNIKKKRKDQVVYVVTCKVLHKVGTSEVMDSSKSGVVGVFNSYGAALFFTEQVADNTAFGDKRTYRLDTDKTNKNDRHFEFRFEQKEKCLYPKLVYDCVQEVVLSYYR